MLRSTLLLACVGVGSLILAAGGAAGSGLPQPSTTKQLPGVECSVTAYGVAFTTSGTAVMSYGGGVSCKGGVGQKTVNVVPEVRKVVNGHETWHVIGGVGLYQGPTPINPLRVSGSTTFVTGHVYRLLVYGGVTLPDGKTSSTTVCSGCEGSTAPTLRVAGYGQNEPFPPRTVPINGIPGLSCSVTEFGSVFKIVNLTYVNTYSGSTSCFGATNVGQRSLKICAQVSNRTSGKTVWYTIAGSCLTKQLTAANPVQLTTGRTAYLGHGYRITASATVKYSTSSGTFTRSATAYGAEAAP